MDTTIPPNRESIMTALRGDTEGALRLLTWIAARLGSNPEHGPDEAIDIDNAVAEYVLALGLPTTADVDEAEEAFWTAVYNS